MNVVILGIDKNEATRVKSSFRSGEHTFTVVNEVPKLIPGLLAQPAALVLLCVERPSPQIVELIGQLRAEAVLEPAQIQLIAPVVDEVTAVKAFQAGLDGVIPKGSSPAYLVQRLAAVERVLATVERKASAPAARSSGGPAAVTTTAGGLATITRAQAWKAVPERLAQAASQFYGLPAKPAEVAAAVSPHLDAARSVVLSSAPHSVDMRLVVGADHGSTHELARHLFGEADEGLVADMLGELSNIFMGALKTAFSGEEIQFTSGLPSAVPVGELMTPSFSFAQRHIVSIEVGSARICVSVGIRSNAPSVVPLSDVAEGMVLSKDVLSERGMLLVSSGTRLSETMIEKLRSLLPAKAPIEVLGS